MLVNGWHSDRSQERIGHVAVPLVCLSLGLFLAGWCHGSGPAAVLVMVLGVGTFMYAHLPAFWPIPTLFLGSAAAASAIGFINMIGNLGGFVGPLLFGEAAAQKAYARGLHTLAPFPLVSVAIILFIGYLRRDRLKASCTGAWLAARRGLVRQEVAGIVVEERRANSLDCHVPKPACCFIHREIDVGEDHHQKIQLIEQGEPIVVEALLEGILADAVLRQGRVVQPQEVQLVGPASVRGKSGDQEMDEVTRRTSAGTRLPVDDGKCPGAGGEIKQQVVQVEIAMHKRLRRLSQITLHGNDLVFQPDAKGHKTIRQKVPNLLEEHLPGLGILPLVLFGLAIESR
jgi:hypothetical protein